MTPAVSVRIPARVIGAVLLFALARGGIAQPSAPNWIVVEVVGDTTYSLDSASVVTASNGLVWAWRKAEFARPIRMRDAGRRDIEITSLRIDCTQSTWVSRESISYLDLKLVRRSLSKSTTVRHRPFRPYDREMLALACAIAAQNRAARVP